MVKLLDSADPGLRKPCEQILTINDSIRKLVGEMIELINKLNETSLVACGLAAPQVGLNISLFVIHLPSVQLVALNPVVTKTQGQYKWVEGCLSLPEKLYKVSRPKLIKFQYTNLDGEMRSAKFHNDFAGICQHEIDHLSGTMIDEIGELCQKG